MTRCVVTSLGGLGLLAAGLGWSFTQARHSGEDRRGNDSDGLVCGADAPARSPLADLLAGCRRHRRIGPGTPAPDAAGACVTREPDGTWKLRIDEVPDLVAEEEGFEFA